MKTPGADLVADMSVLPEMLGRSEASTNSVEKMMEPPQTGGRSATSTPAVLPAVEVRKRKADREEQESSSNTLTSKRSRSSSLGLHLVNGASLTSEKDQERRRKLILDRVHLLEQISRMNEDILTKCVTIHP